VSQITNSNLWTLLNSLCRTARALTKQRRRGRHPFVPYTTCHNNNVPLHVSSMDEPSIQLQLDLSRAVQHELAACRPLLHRLQGGSWVLQIPRPKRAVSHGARFYYNILVDPCFVKQTNLSNGWFSQPSHTSDHLQTTIALEELLRNLEILANDLRPESSRKSPPNKSPHYNNFVQWEQSTSWDTMAVMTGEPQPPWPGFLSGWG
jgi:hypothetical protein